MVCLVIKNVEREKIMEINKKVFSTNLKNFRVQAGMTQEFLANKIGVSLATYRRYELGNSIPDVEKLLELSSIFDIPAEYLVKHDYSKGKPTTPGFRDPVVKAGSYRFFSGQQYYVYYLSEKADDRLKTGLLIFDENHDIKRQYIHGALRMHHEYDCKLLIDGSTIIIYGTGKYDPQRVVIALHLPDFGDDKDFNYRGGIGVMIHRDTHGNQSAQRICLSYKKISYDNTEGMEEIKKVLSIDGVSQIKVRVEDDSDFNQWALYYEPKCDIT